MSPGVVYVLVQYGVFSRKIKGWGRQLRIDPKNHKAETGMSGDSRTGQGGRRTGDRRIEEDESVEKGLVCRGEDSVRADESASRTGAT